MQSILNSANEFLAAHLFRRRKICENRRDLHGVALFKKALNSIASYPLPIICEEQLEILAGIGESLKAELIKLIETQYKLYLKAQIGDQKCDDIGLHPIKENLQFSQMSSNNRRAAQVRLAQRIQDHDETSSGIVNLETTVRLNSQTGQLDQDITNQNSISNSNNTKTKWKTPFTGDILIALQQLGPMSRQNLKKALSKDKKVDNRRLKAGEELLTNSQLIREEDGVIHVTQIGKVQIPAIKIQKSKQQAKSKIKGLAVQLKTQLEQILESEGKEEDEEEEVIRVQCDPLLANTLKLVIDIREVRERKDSNYFEQRLAKFQNVACCTEVLSIGDFLWVCGDKVVDFIIERKKADDLVASIISSDRYKEQKDRLKSCGVSRLTYLYEGHPSPQMAKYSRQIESALINTFVRDGFKVIRVSDPSQTVRYLSFVHSQLKRQIEAGRAYCLNQTLKQFNLANAKKANATVGTVFRDCLRSLPSLGGLGTGVITRYFKSFHSLYDRLNSLETNHEREALLTEMFRGSHINKTVPHLIVSTIFG